MGDTLKRINKLGTSNDYVFFNKKRVINFLYRLLVTCVITVTAMILIKGDIISEKQLNLVYDDSWNFAMFSEWYEDNFGSVLPINNEDIPVFDEKLEYENASLYHEGVMLLVSDNYLVPALESGIVVFIGNKDNYGETIIVQQVNGIDVWYSNIETNSYKMYDYIEKGMLIGETIGDNIYLVFEREGEYLDYNQYIN